MKTYFRISDAGTKTERLPGGTKELCLVNALQIFENVTIIADNCTPKTFGFINNLPFENYDIVKTSLGNSGSFMKALDLSLDQEEELIYFVEDDYFHRDHSSDVIHEALSLPLKPSYVTLYDHPDKYTPMYSWGEISGVVRTKSTHWRYSVSTTMTFASTKQNLIEDYDLWKEHTKSSMPNDHLAFMDLQSKDKFLAVSIPGRSCNLDIAMLSNQTFIDGTKGLDMVEWWVVDFMEQLLRSILIPEYGEEKLNKMLEPHDRLNQMRIMSTLCGDRLIPTF